MNNRNKLKFQLFLSIGFASLIIICSTVYFFKQLSSFLQKNEEIISNTLQQTSYANKLESDLFKLIQYKTDYLAQNKHLNNLPYQSTINEISHTLLALENSSKQSKKSAIVQEFDKLNTISLEITDIQRFIENIQDNPKDKVISDLIGEQTKAKTTLDQFINELILARQTKLKESSTNITIAKRITITSITVALFIILYTFIKVYQILQYVRQSRLELKQLNTDFQTATTNIENTNWALQSVSLLNEKLSGVDDENKISKEVLDMFNTVLPLATSAMYIRKVDSDEFHLKSSQGINAVHRLTTFKSGEGYLGKVADDKTIVKVPITEYVRLKSETSIIDQLPTIVYLCPLVYEDQCIGLIELSISGNTPETAERYDIFLQRVCRNIAMSVRFGQSHMLVEQLLEETQQQAEELEAQQEELRITNDELVHKTHLLETSEEELRVQQEELMQANFELNQKAHELEKRNIELNKAQQVVEQKVEEVQQASAYKSEFMANMSHELRTPLNSILILAKLLGDNKGQNLSEEQVKFARIIHGAGTDLLDLINDLLDLAKIESGKMELNLDAILLQDFAQHIEGLFKELAKDKGIDFRIDIDSDAPNQIISDEYRIQQVLKNFLSNAFKFTPKQGKVVFSIFEQDNLIHFQVKDTGKGISKEKQDLIFEAFRQEDGSTNRKYGGTGLGLSISREIAFLLKGKIRLESEIDKGSTFTLVIPIELKAEPTITDNAATQVIEEKSSKISLSPKNNPEDSIVQKDKEILIIEDDINFADILRGFAENYGFNVQLAHDGAMGIKLAKERIPSAIILDVMLPIADGWKVLDALKSDENTKHIPIHMMSAAAFQKKDFLEKGAIGFMHKPVTEKTIQKTFENIDLNLSKSVKKILLIEDQELQSDFIKQTFSEHQINVIQAFSIEAGINKMKEEPNIDCIILDLVLPDGNGIDFIEVLKEDPLLNNVPIIINTAAELSKEQHDKILSYARATILKSDKSNDRLIDEVQLFLNKINDVSYKPIKDPAKINRLDNHSNLEGKTVLIADDDMRNVIALSTSLQAYNMNIEIANNGLEAVKIIEERGEKIDIVLMDIMMPEMDGLEAIQRIRSNMRYKNLPILAVTAKAMKGDKEKSLQVGANDYVSKPIDIDKLTSLMQIWMG